MLNFAHESVLQHSRWPCVSTARAFFKILVSLA